MKFGLIISLALLVYLALSVLFAVLRARRRGWIMATVRIGATLLAAVVAFVLAKWIPTLVLDEIFDTLTPQLGEGLGGFISEVPAGIEGVRVLAALIAAPILFFVLFLILRIIFAIVCKIVEVCVPFLKVRSLKALTMSLGAVNAILVMLITLVPLFGFVVLGNHALAAMEEAKLVEDMGEVSGIVDDIATSPAVTVVHTLGKPLFNGLTTGELDAEATHGVKITLNLENELCGIIKAGGSAVQAMSVMDGDNFSEEDKQLLSDMADNLLASDWVELVATDSLVALSSSWLRGEAFIGLEPPVLDATITPTFNHFLLVLATETTETISADLHTLLDVIGDLLSYGFMGENMDYAQMVKDMSQNGMLTSILSKLEANERFVSLSTELKSLGLRMVTSMLGVESLQSGEHAELMENVAGSLNDVMYMEKEERDAVIQESLSEAFGNSGFEVSGDVVTNLSDEIIEELGADGEITAEELTDFLVQKSEEGFDIPFDQLPENLRPAA